MKNKIFINGFFVLLSILTVSCHTDKNKLEVSEKGRTAVLFDAGWKFFRGDSIDAFINDFDDSSWRLLDLPHDWSIEDIPGTNSPVDSNAVGRSSMGYLVGGTAWYRKTFYVSRGLKGKNVTLRFDGVYMNSEVWLNGVSLGSHPYGYTSFFYDITDKIIPGKENTIAVKVANEGRNSRWYSGSGIYRHVWITATDPVHVGNWGTLISTPQARVDNSPVYVKTSVINDSPDPADVALITRILKADGTELASSESTQSIPVGAAYEFNQTLEVASPTLWSPETPYLYTAVNEVYTMSGNDRSDLLDRTETKFGIRDILVSTEGFLLNGERILLKGGCMHHDNGPLGAAAFDRAEERRVELMKANGFNAIRCSHNPPSPAFLDACDRLGILVIDEIFDMWKEPKNKEDYHLYFDEWWQKDLSSMLLRDYNHPSVVIWSIGNEIPERGKPEGAALAHLLTDYVKTIDTLRPVTSAVNFTTPDKDPYFAALDISGYNYANDNYVTDHKRIPERIIMGTESFPLKAYENWMAVLDYPWVIGDFVWTGFDYLGEASIGWLGFAFGQSFYPWTLAYCGDIDVCGWKRPQSYYRDALWKEDQISIYVKTPEPTYEINKITKVESRWSWPDEVASWNWTGSEGKSFDINVYSSCDEVELFLNGKSLGRKKTGRETRFTATFSTLYQAGVLSAKGYKNNSEVASCEIKTTGSPEKVALSADRSTINADGQDLCYVTVELLDSSDSRNPLAKNHIDFTIDGPGSIIAVGSSDPMGTESFTRPERNAYQGRCLVVLRSGNKSGEIKLKASSEGLTSGEIVISSVGRIL